MSTVLRRPEPFSLQAVYWLFLLQVLCPGPKRLVVRDTDSDIDNPSSLVVKWLPKNSIGRPDL
jgi:hypothetical protein